jgi:hypothetical protein
MMSFELIAKVAFDNLLELAATVRQLDREIPYFGSTSAAELAQFEADADADPAAFEASDAA